MDGKTCWMFALLTLAAGGAAIAGEGGRNTPSRWGVPPAAQKLERAENHLDVAYLPARLAGADDDRWLRMNVHVPAGKGPFPCVVMIHGGGYMNGDKDYTFTGSSSPKRPHMQHLVDNGYVVVNLNYILGRGIKPQVYWDFRAAVRFLRANAQRYKLDPGRMAAWGFSAGGWLSSSAGLSTAGDALEVRMAQAVIGQRAYGSVRVAMDDPRPTNPEFSSRLSAIAADFWENTQFASADDPACLGYAGQGALHVIADDARRGGLDFTSLELQGAKYAGQSKVHMPEWTTEVKGPFLAEPVVISEAVFRWLDLKLNREPRCIAPEARPNRRWFTEGVEVTLVAASEDAATRYTIDGTDPTPDSPKFAGPISLRQTTTIKAVTSRKGEKDSAVATFTFTRSEPEPLLTAPASGPLPEAAVGKAYAAQFTTDARGPVVWNLAGHLQLDADAKPRDGRPQDPCGLRLDPKTGQLAGTPTHAGLYTFQVQVAAATGKPADARTYVLKVKP